jgi:hypothetical protein
MSDIIRLKDENISILIVPQDELEKECSVSINSVVAHYIKCIHRYGTFSSTKNLMLRVLWLALKGDGCKKDHLDIAQRQSLYEYFKDKEINDPYIKQFVKDTKENFNVAI